LVTSSSYSACIRPGHVEELCVISLMVHAQKFLDNLFHPSINSASCKILNRLPNRGAIGGTLNTINIQSRLLAGLITARRIYRAVVRIFVVHDQAQPYLCQIAF
jgi:hypothetical protein